MTCIGEVVGPHVFALQFFARQAALAFALDREVAFYAADGSRNGYSHASEINQETACWTSCALWRHVLLHNDWLH